MKRLLLITLAFIIVFGCKKNNTNNNDPAVPPPINSSNPPVVEFGANTILIDKITSEVIESVDSAKIVFNGNTKQLASLTIGKIIISGIAKNAPFGFLRKITQIQNNGNTYTFKTSEVPLTEAFKELHVDYTKKYTSSDTMARVMGTSFLIESPELVLYDKDGDESTKFDQIRMNINYEVSPDLHIQINIELFRLKSAKIECSFQSSIKQIISAGGTLGSFSKELKIFSKPLAPFTIPFTPLVIVPNLRVSVGAQGSVNVEITATTTSTASISAFLEYQNGSWNKGYGQSFDNQFDFSGIRGNANAKIYIEPGVDFKLYNSDWAKGSIIAQGYLKATGQLLPIPGCELRTGISAGAEANLQFFDWNFVSASYPEIFDYSKVLYTCSANGLQLPALTTTSATAINETSASSGGNITNDGGATINARGICWSTTQNPTTADSKTADGTGTGIFNSSISGLSTNTTYYARAYAINVVGTAYGNEISFTTKQSNATLPVLSTTNITGITPTTAQGGGVITSDGGASIIARGVCWSTNPNPTIANSKTVNGTGTGSFNSSITSLTANHTYYVRSYATNSAGTAYGGQLNFTTTDGIIFNPSLTYGSVTDVEGNQYKTIQIETQTWMAENLKTSKYRNGELIPTNLSDVNWQATKAGAYAFPDNNVNNNAIYGKLYNWYAIDDSRKVCPVGWHIPTDEEWSTLVNFLEGKDVAGDALREVGGSHWASSNTGNNSSGFSAPGADERDYRGVYRWMRVACNFWTSTSQCCGSEWGMSRNIEYYRGLVQSIYEGKSSGFSVRCVKD
jgi:uncharacterized protein (TIGR02145 family)